MSVSSWDASINSQILVGHSVILSFWSKKLSNESLIINDHYDQIVSAKFGKQLKINSSELLQSIESI